MRNIVGLFVTAFLGAYSTGSLLIHLTSRPPYHTPVTTREQQCSARPEYQQPVLAAVAWWPMLGYQAALADRGGPRKPVW